MIGRRRVRAVPLALALCALAGAVRADGTHERVELSLTAGVYRFAAEQDLGGIDQLAVARSGALATTLAAFDLRAAYCPWSRLCLGAVAELIPGQIGGAAALGIGYRGEALVHLLSGRLRPFVLVTGGGLTLFSPESVLGVDTDPTAGWGVGAKVRLGRRWLLRLDLCHLLTDGQGDAELAHNLSLTAGVGYGLLSRPLRQPPPLDRDGDGLTAPQDRCPDQAEDPDGFEDGDGCPDPDNDGDGLADHLDICPGQAGPAPRGCPAARR